MFIENRFVKLVCCWPKHCSDFCSVEIFFQASNTKDDSFFYVSHRQRSCMHHHMLLWLANLFRLKSNLALTQVNYEFSLLLSFHQHHQILCPCDMLFTLWHVVCILFSLFSANGNFLNKSLLCFWWKCIRKNSYIFDIISFLYVNSGWVKWGLRDDIIWACIRRRCIVWYMSRAMHSICAVYIIFWCALAAQMEFCNLFSLRSFSCIF